MRVRAKSYETAIVDEVQLAKDAQKLLQEYQQQGKPLLNAKTITAISDRYDTSYPVREAQGFSGVMFDIADFVNMKRNYFPSLHVSFAFTAALFYSSKTNKAGALLFFIWASAISVSTILIHEHYLIDVIAGILLAFVCWKIIGRWAIRKEVMQASQTRLKSLYDQFS